MAADDDIAELEVRFRALRYDGPGALSRAFTMDEARRYIAAKAHLPTDFSYPYRTILEEFPRQWWSPVLTELLEGPDSPGASAFVDAAFEVAPDLFESAPEHAARWLDRSRAFAWLRARPELSRAGLLRVLNDAAASWRWRAAGFLLLLDRALAPTVAAAIGALDAEQQAAARWALLDHGWDSGDGLRPLWPSLTFHLVFAHEYIAPTSDHPTWHTTEFAPGDHAFGGRVGGLAHVLTLDPVPRELGISLSRLVLVIDLDFASDDGSEQYFHHDANGNPLRDKVQEHPPFAQSRVQLATTRPEHIVQSWGASTGRENLLRLGGPPVFVQAPVYPKCERCERRMTHILSLDSEIPLERAGWNQMSTWDWGSGGVANAFWCDACRISAWTHACT